MSDRDSRVGSAGTAVVLALILNAGCVKPTGPALPAEAVPFSPPPVYMTWWGDVEKCATVTGAFSSVTWYVVPNASYFVVNGSTYSGFWYGQSNSIVLAQFGSDTATIVRHEMLHALLQRGDHPPEYFQQRCRGVVDCSSQCVTDPRATP